MLPHLLAWAGGGGSQTLTAVRALALRPRSSVVVQLMVMVPAGAPAVSSVVCAPLGVRRPPEAVKA